ncbi:hypothetical protein GAYE_SCF09G3193 [Galdieria yellowstonensis]|jgi:gamma-glutamylaminecyclotransferase|uniref:Gamma-glutamylcyclotransferase family protein n=1 Tax=Galdieria yellowstonensis TaxID=3028027 RepID=A0AAV9ICT6_9RHOD|nr:hypothetical protein GAYE_SCF09G3193 [Galdieria yellowstonensis]
MFVFIYGTLKRGFPNHEFMQGTFQSEALTVEQYPLVVGTRMGVPFLLMFPGQGKRVKGELYMVNETQLEYLDEFEAVQQGLYFRERIQVEQLVDAPKQGIVEAWAYFRGTGGPYWACDVDSLFRNQHLEEYTQQYTKNFIPRNQR